MSSSAALPALGTPAPHDPTVSAQPSESAGSPALALGVRQVAAELGGEQHGPRLALRMAAAAAVLWARFHRFDAADPRWPDRDRFLVSPGQGAAMLYALLHLTGHAGMGQDALAAFGQPHAACAVPPDATAHPAVEASGGPPGQGVALAVGMALAERLLAARFGRSLVDHRTWVVAEPADLIDGAGWEAATLAGELRLGRLTVLLDDTGESDWAKRLAAFGWAATRVDAQDGAAVGAALSMALRSHKPTLIACRTLGDGLVPAELAVPEALAARWQEVGARGEKARRAWLKRLAANSQRGEFERAVAGQLPPGWHEAALPEALAQAVPDLVAGAVAEAAVPAGLASIAPGQFAGRAVPFGARPRAMALAMVGMAAHGGVVPLGAAPLAASDAVRPALRLAAQMRLRVLFVMSHDDPPEDGAASHVAALRSAEGAAVLEATPACWAQALRRADGPSAMMSGVAVGRPPLVAAAGLRVLARARGYQRGRLGAASRIAD